MDHYQRYLLGGSPLHPEVSRIRQTDAYQPTGYIINPPADLLMVIQRRQKGLAVSVLADSCKHEGDS